MNQLTTAEKKLINNLSMIHDPDVKLGDILAAIIGQSAEEGTPVNAANASGTLTISGVVKDGEKVTIGTDIYEFLSDADQTKTSPGNIAVDIEANTVKATGTLTMDTQPMPGDTITIGPKTYIFVPVGTDNADGEISIGADLAAAQAALVGAINGLDGLNTAHPSVTAGAFASDDCVITAKIGGTVGNSIATTETFTAATNVFASGTLGTGADCSAANAVTALAAAIMANDTVGVSAADGAGDTVVLTANIAGAAANSIITTETMTNGAFGAATLTSGVDGTVADGSKFMMDATYLYVCLDGNTISEKNWRRVSLGSAY